MNRKTLIKIIHIPILFSGIMFLIYKDYQAIVALAVICFVSRMILKLDEIR